MKTHACSYTLPIHILYKTSKFELYLLQTIPYCIYWNCFCSQRTGMHVACLETLLVHGLKTLCVYGVESVTVFIVNPCMQMDFQKYAISVCMHSKFCFSYIPNCTVTFL